MRLVAGPCSSLGCCGFRPRMWGALSSFCQSGNTSGPEAGVDLFHPSASILQKVSNSAQLYQAAATLLLWATASRRSRLSLGSRRSGRRPSLFVCLGRHGSAVATVGKGRSREVTGQRKLSPPRHLTGGSAALPSRPLCLRWWRRSSQGRPADRSDSAGPGDSRRPGEATAAPQHFGPEPRCLRACPASVPRFRDTPSQDRVLLALSPGRN